jgi:DnaK suppressor protein
MPAKKTASTKRKPAKASRKKAAKRKPVTRKKPPGKKRIVTKKKASAKKSSKKKKTVARKKPAANKKVAKKKVSKKKLSRKKAPSKKASSKKAAKKKPVAKKKAAKKTASRKKVSKKKVSKKKVSKKAVSSKKVSPKKVAKKAPSRKKAVARKAPARKARSAADMLSGPIHGVEPYVASRGEDYMNAEQLEHFKAILAAWKHELMNEVDRTVHHMQDEAANFPDPNDRATQESEFGLELRTRDRERKLLRKINSALVRIDEGTYGYCEETGEEIGLKRLEARPVATLCLEAQERRELAERQFRDRDDRYR